MFFNASSSSLRLAGLWSKSLASKKCQSSLRWLQRLPPQRQLKNTASWDLLSFACAFRVTQQPPYTETRRHVRVCKSQILFLQHSTRSRYSVYYSEFLICVLAPRLGPYSHHPPAQKVPRPSSCDSWPQQGQQELEPSNEGESTGWKSAATLKQVS